MDQWNTDTDCEDVMKVFVAVVNRDGRTYKEDGKTITPIEQISTYYVAESIHQVYEAVIEALIEDFGDELITIHEHFSSVTIIDDVATPHKTARPNEQED